VCDRYSVWWRSVGKQHTVDDYTSTTTASTIIQIIQGNIKFNVYCSRTNRRLDRLLITGSWHCTLLANTVKVYGKNAQGTREGYARGVGLPDRKGP